MGHRDPKVILELQRKQLATGIKISASNGKMEKCLDYITQKGAPHALPATDMDALMVELRRQIEQLGVSTVTQQLRDMGVPGSAEARAGTEQVSQLLDPRSQQLQPQTAAQTVELPQAPHTPAGGSIYRPETVKLRSLWKRRLLVLHKKIQISIRFQRREAEGTQRCGSFPCFVLFVTVFTLSRCDDPGLKLRIFQKGLDNANGAVKEFLENKIRDLRVGKLIGYGNGSLQFNISYTKLLNFTIINSSMTIVPDTGIQITISNSNATINSVWKARNETSEVKNITVMKVSEASITMVINISKNDPEYPLFSVVNCTTDIKKIDIKLGNAIEPMFENKEELKNEVLSLLNPQVCRAVTENFELWTTNISTFSGRYDVNRYVGINYQLVNSPVFTEKYFDVNINGSFYAINGTDHPVAPANFSFLDSNDSAMCIGISEAALNSVAQAYYDARFFRLTFTHPMINKSVAEWNGEQNSIYARGILNATKAPEFILNPKNITMNFNADLLLVTKEPNKTRVLVVTINTESSISATVSISEANSTLNVSGSLTLNSLDLNVISNQTTTNTKDEELKKSMKEFLEKPLMEYFNKLYTKD
ncbi:bactericidal permeability-increasing protein-like [Microcaecilia unicolor]|uniref:Bactericidal permeability-increasing protein n=1 Tax=Microcaecilia unicolor TaxID=1415580 RepID=A0A6P7YXR9_9AMPH|nr:bactericidal permeability-increasing protein-like [Microcaecilia unicolor]